jgi:hypothetical protein
MAAGLLQLDRLSRAVRNAHVVRNFRRPRNAREAREGGQALVLFAFMVMAMLFMAALLFDGAQAIVNRRVLQNAADAGALAGANVLRVGGNGCSGGTSTTPRSTVATAALTAAALNLTAAPPTDPIAVTCPTGYNDGAVEVTISGTSPSFFGGILRLAMTEAQADSWTPGIAVRASGTAMLGGAPGNKFSVVELNPHNPSWASGNRGCPSVLFSGGPTVTFDGSMHINSSCPAADNGAMGTNGNAASLTFNGEAVASLTGGYAPGPLVVVPAPLTGQPRVADPMRNLPALTTSSLTVRSSTRLTLNNQIQILEPGIYTGGIRLQNTSQAWLKPGIYVIDGGGIDVGSQAGIFSIESSTVATSILTWASDCRQGACGVLLYNRAGSSTAMGSISIGAGATVMLRPYQPNVDLTGMSVEAYRNLLFWQTASPLPATNFNQPQISLGGGGVLSMSGTLYAPSAKIYLTGGSGGAGGDALDLTLQFVTWDMQIQGNSSFHFHYSNENFAKPILYGLVE